MPKVSREELAADQEYDDEWSPSSYDYDSEQAQYWGGGPLRTDWVGRCRVCLRCRLIGEDDWVSQGKWMNGVCDYEVQVTVDDALPDHFQWRLCGGPVYAVLDPLERDAMIAALLVAGEA